MVNNIDVKSLISKTVNAEKWMVSAAQSKFWHGEWSTPKNWWLSTNGVLRRSIKIVYFLTILKNDNRVNMVNMLKIWFCIKNNKTVLIFLMLFRNYWLNLEFLKSHLYFLSQFPTWSITLTKVTFLVSNIDHLEPALYHYLTLTIYLPHT